jgi:hypothetical protein
MAGASVWTGEPGVMISGRGVEAGLQPDKQYYQDQQSRHSFLNLI